MKDDLENGDDSIDAENAITWIIRKGDKALSANTVPMWTHAWDQEELTVQIFQG